MADSTNPRTQDTPSSLSPDVNYSIRQGIRIKTNDDMAYGRVWLVDTLEDGSERLTEIREVMYTRFEAEAGSYPMGRVSLRIGGNIDIDILDPLYISQVQEEAARLAKSFEISDNHDSGVKISLE